MSHASKQNRLQIIGAAGALALALTVATARVAAQATIDTLAFSGPGSAWGFGSTIAGVGDIDGDGHDDFVAGAYDGGASGAGSVQILSGADSSVIREWAGDVADDGFGLCVDSAGDVDGDGLDDVVVGAVWADSSGSNAGLVRVYSSATGALLYEVPGLAAQDEFGRVVAGVGDLDHDGHGDFAGASNRGSGSSGLSGAGYVRIVSGADGHEFVRIEGQLVGQALGSNVRPAGDFDADGTPDVVVMTNPFPAPNHAVVYSGTWIVSRASPQVLLDYSNKTLYLAVDAAGDLDLDGWDDLLLGTPRLDLGFPLGKPGGWMALSGRDHSMLLRWIGPAGIGQTAGFSIAGAGDIDRDGVGDVLVGADSMVLEAPDGPARVFSGADGSLLYASSLADPFQDFGRCVAGVGDLNADGFLDWAVGAPAGAPCTITLYSAAGIWDELGQGLAGSAGVPALSGAGLLLGGDGMSIGLAGALPNQPFVLVIGLSAVKLPFHGGVFVPDAGLLLFDVTDAGGGHQWASTWPLGLPAMSFYFQAWMQDPQAVEGWAASNGLRAQSP